MLEELHVSNLGLLEDARLEPGPGLVVVTGETGAGKTMLLGALQLLRGETARRDRVGPAGAELLVEGRFITATGEIVASRRVNREGRSRAYEDGAMVTASRLAATCGPLMEIVAQHETLRLSTPSGILDLLDAALPPDGRARLEDYQRAWRELERLREEQESLGGDRRVLERELDGLRGQAEEIDAAGIVAGEDAELADVAERLRNAAALTAGLTAAHSSLVDDGGAIDRLGNVIAELRRLVTIAASLEPLHAQAVAASDLLGELAGELARAAATIEHDSPSLERVEERIRHLGDLRRKYGETLRDVLDFGSAAERRAAELQRRLASAASLRDDIVKAEQAVEEAAAVLRTVRLARAGELVDSAVGHLQELGLPDPAVRVDIDEGVPGPTGADRLRLSFASDASLPAGPLRRIASGGELSRLVLSLRLAAGSADVPIVAFDEIDAGVGGVTALAMGEKLARLAAGRQVFCVSHLPQIAAFADTHIVVERTGATAVARRVEGSARAREIARMLAGLGDTDTGVEHAEELLAVAAKRLAAKG